MMTMIVMIMIVMMIIMAMIMMMTMSMMIMSMISMATMMMIMISMMMVMTSSSYPKVLMEDTTVHHGIMKRQIDSETRALFLVSGCSEVDG
jgi:hypothetical protein